MIRGLMGVVERIEELEALLAARPTAVPSLNTASTQATAGAVSPQAFSQVLEAALNDSGEALGGGKFADLVKQAAAKYGMDARLIDAVIRVESDYNPRCVSRAGAMGLMQLMPENCRDYGVRDPFDPAQNIDAGVRQLKDLLTRFGRLDLALAAYNAGPGAVRRYGGIPPYPETQAYVKKILQLLAEG